VGQSKVLHGGLNATGRKLLGSAYRLSATLTLAAGATRVVTFRYALLPSLILFNVSYGKTKTTFVGLTAKLVPPGTAITVRCSHGPRCAKRFARKHGTVNLTAAVAGKTFHPGSLITVTLTRPNTIGLVDVMKVRRGNQPSFTKLCLPPGARRPSRCHRG
jgi:hypothetical protein